MIQSLGIRDSLEHSNWIANLIDSTRHELHLNSLSALEVFYIPVTIDNRQSKHGYCAKAVACTITEL